MLPAAPNFRAAEIEDGLFAAQKRRISGQTRKAIVLSLDAAYLSAIRALDFKTLSRLH